MEIFLDFVAIGSICYDDVTGILPCHQRMRQSFHSNYRNLRRLHIVALLPFCAIFRAILHETKEAQKQESLSK